MKYEGRVRRRIRQARRLAAAATHRSAWGAPVIPTYWWDGHPNFGDALTPWILPTLGVVPLYREPRHARLVGVGSLLEFMPDGYDGSIWGTGLMSDVEKPLPGARALAVRGPLTEERIGAGGAAYGDPGLLVSRVLPRPTPHGCFTIVPHGHHRSHAGLARLAASSNANVINVHREAKPTVRDIARGGLVLTTSLHGLITADSYGIPAVWTTLEPALGGGDFKFRDYEAAVTPGRSRFVAFDDIATADDIERYASRADAARVAELNDGLVAAARGIVGEGLVGAVRRFPGGVLGA